MKVNTSSFLFIALFVFCRFCAGVPPVKAQAAAKAVKTVKKTANVRRAAPVRVVYRRMTPADFVVLIHQTASAYGVSPKLYESLLRVEGGGYCNSSPAGARGPAQLMPATARRFGLRVDAQVDERCDLVKSLAVGARYLRFQLDTFKDVRLALAGYNAGEGAVIQYGYKIPPFKETVQYVEKICFLTYGKVGLAIERSYNRAQAYWMVDAVYRGKYPIPGALPGSAAAVPTDSVQSESTDAQNTNPNRDLPLPESSSLAAPSATTAQPAPLVRKTVRISAVEPRLATSSLSFWKVN